MVPIIADKTFKSLEDKQLNNGIFNLTKYLCSVNIAT